jgi:hypothetical protein
MRGLLDPLWRDVQQGVLPRKYLLVSFALACQTAFEGLNAFA